MLDIYDPKLFAGTESSTVLHLSIENTEIGVSFYDGEAWSTTSWMSFIATPKQRKRKVAQYYLGFGFDFSIFSNCFLVYRSDSSDLLGPLGPPLPGEAAAA